MTLDRAVAARPDERAAALALVVGTPLLFLLLGLLLRYAAFVSSSDEHGFLAFTQALCRWDCGWYIGIAERPGYHGFPIPGGNNVGSWGFFPLYPLLVSALTSVVPLPTLMVGSLTSMLLSFIAALAAWPLLGRNIRAYTLYCAFLLAGPFSFHVTTMLTESLFVLLITLVFLMLQRCRYLAAGIFSALLSATRIVGVFIVFATLAKLVEDHRREGGTMRAFPAALLARPDLLLAVVISPLGLFAYMLYLHLLIGDGFAFSHVQRAFGRSIADPLSQLFYGFQAWKFEGWRPVWVPWSAFAALGGLMLCAVLAWRRHYGAALFCALCILLPLSAGLASMVRYVMGLAPLTMLACTLLSRNRLLWLAGFVLFLAGCWFNTIAWMEGSLVLV